MSGGIMLKILGVDPGIHGGLAVVAVNSASSVQLLDAVVGLRLTVM